MDEKKMECIRGLKASSKEISENKREKTSKCDLRI
jgi:hypothetical protein